VVEADVDALLLGELPRGLRAGDDVEADDDGAGRLGEDDVRLVDAADRGVLDADGPPRSPPIFSIERLADVSTEPCTSALTTSGSLLDGRPPRAARRCCRA
jgi:hypothetical protein